MQLSRPGQATAPSMHSQASSLHATPGKGIHAPMLAGRHAHWPDRRPSMISILHCMRPSNVTTHDIMPALPTCTLHDMSCPHSPCYCPCTLQIFSGGALHPMHMLHPHMHNPSFSMHSKCSHMHVIFNVRLISRCNRELQSEQPAISDLEEMPSLQHHLKRTCMCMHSKHSAPGKGLFLQQISSEAHNHDIRTVKQTDSIIPCRMTVVHLEPRLPAVAKKSDCQCHFPGVLLSNLANTKPSFAVISSIQQATVAVFACRMALGCRPWKFLHRAARCLATH